MIVRRTNLACLIAALLAATGTDAAHAEALRFETDVRPILKAACFHCHGEEKKKSGGLDVRLVHLMQTGGDSGEAIVPGDPEASLLWQQVASDEMPDGPKKLTADQKQIIRDWIAQGAKTIRLEPKDPDSVRFTEEELGHWAFQPVKEPRVPRPGGFDIWTPIDAFVAERLAKRGLASPFLYLARMGKRGEGCRGQSRPWHGGIRRCSGCSGRAATRGQAHLTRRRQAPFGFLLGLARRPA